MRSNQEVYHLELWNPPRSSVWYALWSSFISHLQIFLVPRNNDLHFLVCIHYCSKQTYSFFPQKQICDADITHSISNVKEKKLRFSEGTCLVYLNMSVLALSLSPNTSYPKFPEKLTQMLFLYLMVLFFPV